MNCTWKALWMTSVVVMILCKSPSVWAVSFTPLGDLPGGVFNSEALAVSADGSVVVGQGQF